MRNYQNYILAVLLFLSLSRCSSPAEPPSSTPEPAPTKVEIRPTATPTPRPSRSGKAVYDKECLACHFLDDVDYLGPGLAGLFEQEMLSDGVPFSEEALAELIAGGTTGAGGMPGTPLAAGEMEALIADMREAIE